MKKFIALGYCIFMSTLFACAIDLWEFQDRADFMYFDFYGENQDTLFFRYLSEDEVTLLSAGTSNDSLYIPSKVTNKDKTYQVTAIADSALYMVEYLHAQLTCIWLPSSIKQIGNRAFENCTALTSIEIPDNVTSIGEDAFTGCTSLPIIDNIRYADTYLIEVVYIASKYTIKEGTKWIGYHAFEGCGLTFIEIPESVISIGESAFAGSGLISIEIPNSVTSIGNGAFSLCTHLTSVEIPESVISIGEGAFDNCENLTSITIGHNLPYATKEEGTRKLLIYYDAFANCENLKSVHIRDITMWCECTGFLIESSNPLCNGADLYLNDAKITKLVIPKIVPEHEPYINKYAFCGCSSLTSLEIPDSVTSIGSLAFGNCTNLDTVYCYAETPPTLGYSSDAFYGIKNTAILYVRDTLVDTYQSIEGYTKSFADIRGMGKSFVDSITTTSARIRWERDSLVATYHICIFDNNKDTVATYTVDSEGNILDSKRYLPSVFHNRHYREESTTESDLLTLTVKDLKPNSAYTYTIDGETKEGKPVEDYHAEGSFHTKDPNGIIDVFIDDPDRSTQKILINGQIYILCGDKIFDLRGQEVR